MSYDIAFRFQQALDPSALITLPTALHALNAAIEDCRNAGRPQDSDPAVLLLARHLGAIASQIERPNVDLRRACMDAIANLRRKPALMRESPQGLPEEMGGQQGVHAGITPPWRQGCTKSFPPRGCPRGAYTFAPALLRGWCLAC